MSKGMCVLVCAVESHSGGAAAVQCYKDPFGHCRSKSPQLSLSLYKNISMLRISVLSPKKLWLKDLCRDRGGVSKSNEWV